jgi:iron complex transport system substrate-binding protein
MLKFFLILSIYLSLDLWASDCQEVRPNHTFRPSETNAFFINYYTGYKIIHQGNDQVLLKNRKFKLECNTRLYQIETPVAKVILTSTTQLPSLELLGLENKLIGFQGKKYIYSSHFKLSTISDISVPLIPEELIKLSPDLVLSYEMNSTSQKYIQQMRKLKIPIVLNNDYLEKNSLGRAEWMIFTASFFDKEEEAQKIFHEIVSKYNNLKNRVGKIHPRKKILVGDIQNGKWVTCGGMSDLATLIHDAGGDLLLSSVSSVTQRRSIEDIYTLKSDVDVWLTQNRWNDQSEILKDSRYKKVNSHLVFNNQLHISPTGSNDYWEMGMARPDLLLEDLIAVFYPDVLHKQELNWYKKL